MLSLFAITVMFARAAIITIAATIAVAIPVDRFSSGALGDVGFGHSKPLRVGGLGCALSGLGIRDWSLGFGISASFC